MTKKTRQYVVLLGAEGEQGMHLDLDEYQADGVRCLICEADFLLAQTASVPIGHLGGYGQLFACVYHLADVVIGHAAFERLIADFRGPTVDCQPTTDSPG